MELRVPLIVIPPSPPHLQSRAPGLSFRHLGSRASDNLEHIIQLHKKTSLYDETLRFGVHPRFAHMVLSGAELGAPELAALLAALLSERDILRGTEAAGRSVCVCMGEPRFGARPGM